MPASSNKTVRCAPRTTARRVGSSPSYRLGSLHYTPEVSATQSPVVNVGLMDPVLGAAEMPALYDGASGPSIKANPSFDLTGGSIYTDLGDIVPNNVKPTISLMDTYTGTAGSPVYSNAVTISNCDIESYVWKFSNGTTSYGKSPSRVFSAPGSYDGELTVTDESGQKAIRKFSVVVK